MGSYKLLFKLSMQGRSKQNFAGKFRFFENSSTNVCTISQTNVVEKRRLLDSVSYHCDPEMNSMFSTNCVRHFSSAVKVHSSVLRPRPRNIWQCRQFLAANRTLCSFNSSTTLWQRFVPLYEDQLVLMTNSSNLFLIPKLHLVEQLRTYKGKKRKEEAESSSDSESDSEDESFEDEESTGAPTTYKLQQIHVSSLRLDNVVSKGLNIGRNRVEEHFYSNKLKLNGKKVVKKSVHLREGDYVDFVTEKLEDVVKVKRVKISRVLPEKTKSDKYILKIKVWQSPFEIQKDETM